MAALPVTEQGRHTRQRIVAAAAEVVAAKGALGASLDEVGARACASRSQLYHYFDDKTDLLRAVAEATSVEAASQPTSASGRSSPETTMAVSPARMWASQRSKPEANTTRMSSSRSPS